MLKSFVPRHSYCVGFNSDGCVFDSMELKHKECFIPMTIKYYRLQSVSKYAREVAEFVNLYSCWRGINRFSALVKVLELLAERPQVIERGYSKPDLRPIQNFIDTTPALGNSALREAVTRTGDPQLQQLLEWSEAVNRDVVNVVLGLPPFPHARESVEKLHGKADLLVVTTTQIEPLRLEWESAAMDQYVSLIAGQEHGKKEDQLRLAAKGKYPPGHILMVGDTMGDLKAAREAEAKFFPIIPGDEVESWRTFYELVIPTFLIDRYTEQEEESFLKEFERALPKSIPWSRLR